MTIDVIFGSLALLLTYLGWRSGVTGQVLRVVAAIAVFFLTAPTSTLIREAMYPEQTVASPGLEVATMFMAAIAVYVGVSLAGGLVIRLMRKTSGALSGMDHLGGALLGGVKAALIVYVLATCALFLYGPLERIDPEDRMHLRDGEATAFAQRYDLIAPWRFPDVGRLQAALRVAELAQRSERAQRELRQHATAQDFIRRAAFETLMGRAALVKAARQGRYAVVLADPEARAFLNDEAQVDALRKIDWERVEEDLGVERLEPTPASEPTEAPAPEASEAGAKTAK